MIRVIAGRWRGKKLAALDGKDQTIRPTTDRMRERLFSMLTHQRYAPMEAAKVLDLCAGTGGLGIEALSRGAGFADFVEQNSQALAALKANLKACGIDASEHGVHAGDARKSLTRLTGPYSFIFADPPYGSTIAQSLLDGVVAHSLLAEDGALVIETHKRDPLETPASLALIDDRKQGIQRLRIFMRDG